MIPFDRASTSPHPATAVGTTPPVPADQVERPVGTDAPRRAVS